MLKHYMQSALGSLLKNRLFSTINIVGLSIGLAACLLIIFYVLDQTSYDKHWEKADRIYRVTTTFDRTGGNPNRMSVNTMLLLPAMRESFGDDIEAGTRSIPYNDTDFYIGDELFVQSVYRVESEFTELFELDVISGSLEATLEDPSSIALSEESALRLFGRTEVVGEVLTERSGDEEIDIRVSAVYRQPEHNTTLDLSALALLDPDAQYWGWTGPFGSTDFILLKEGVDPAAIEARFPQLVDTYVDISAMQVGPDVSASDRMGFQLQNVRDIYLHSPFDGIRDDRGSTTAVLAFSAIAVLVLLIGCINFTVLSTSRATQRAKEVAMRKTIGANRKQLVFQFLGESLLIVLFSIALALALMELLMPVFETLVGSSLNVSWRSPDIYLTMLSLWLAVGLIGGLYPAFVLSWFRPATILKANRSTSAPGSIGLRSFLVVFQFGISIALIIATAVIYAQVQYAMQRDPGFNAENLLVIDDLQRYPAVNRNKNALEDRVSGLPNVVSTSLSGHQPMQRFGNSTHDFPYRQAQAGSGALPSQIPTLMVDHDFFRTYDIPIMAGRNFDESRDRYSGLFEFASLEGEATRSNIIINVSAVRELGFDSPEAALGERITTSSYANNTMLFDIIGIVPDTQFFTLRREGRPEIYVLDNNMAAVLTVRYSGSPQTIMEEVNEIWNAMMPRPISTGYVEQSLENEFTRELVEAQMLVSFSLLAIIIACLGLYGSAAFAIDRRTKEIGIRKVMGAEIREIVTMLLWQFSRPVLVANLIAWPVGMWAMLTWLQRFPYQIDTMLMIPISILAGALVLSIAWLTVAGHSWRVAVRSPVHALRYE